MNTCTEESNVVNLHKDIDDMTIEEYTEIFNNEIVPAMREDELRKVISNELDQDELEELLLRVVNRANIRMSIIEEKTL
ncbi:hypothetical protein [Priestia flexa]|uniref:hypothetical protein n=1 Tax=Priestia flexa TaxID=86664 RepID=UPI000473045A|nr:hypothetical protein [Priestia flexa]